MKQTHNHGFKIQIKCLPKHQTKKKKRKKLQTHNHWSKPRSMVSLNHTKCLPKHQTTKKNGKKNTAKRAQKHCVTVTRRRVGWARSGDVLREEVRPVRASSRTKRNGALLYLKWRDEVKTSDMTEEPLVWAWKGAQHVICSDCVGPGK